MITNETDIGVLNLSKEITPKVGGKETRPKKKFKPWYKNKDSSTSNGKTNEYSNNQNHNNSNNSNYNNNKNYKNTNNYYSNNSSNNGRKNQASDSQ